MIGGLSAGFGNHTGRPPCCYCACSWRRM